MRGVALLLSNNPTLYRTPRLRILLNGRIIAGAYEAETNANNSYGANTFSVVIALGLDPWADAQFWSSEAFMQIEILFSLDGGQNFASLMLGTVDTVFIDHVGKEVHVQGRDLTAELIETPTQETFANRTSSEIAAIFAGRHGLSPIVTPTVTPVGRFYESDHESITLNSFAKATTEWDLLVYLAQQENYDVFVRGSSLYFQPIADASMVAGVIRPTDVTQLRLERAVALAGEVQVTVKSWNTQLQKAFLVQAIGTIPQAPLVVSGNSPRPSRYVLVRPNLTPDKALTIAAQRLSELTRHERSIEFSMPGELILAPGNLISLSGTKTDFDQLYYIDSIARTFRIKTGFLQHVRASNSTPRTVTVADSAG